MENTRGKCCISVILWGCVDLATQRIAENIFYIEFVEVISRIESNANKISCQCCWYFCQARFKYFDAPLKRVVSATFSPFISFEILGVCVCVMGVRAYLVKWRQRSHYFYFLSSGRIMNRSGCCCWCWYCCEHFIHFKMRHKEK